MLKKLILLGLLLTTPAVADQGVINPTTSFSLIANPFSILTLTSATTAYSANQLIANSATAGQVTVPVVILPKPTTFIPRVRLSSNDATTTAWPAQTIQIDLWSSAPTFTNGDRAAFAVATGSANHLGAYTCIMSASNGDGYYAECGPAVGSAPAYALNTSSLYWTAQAITGSGVTGATKTLTLTIETLE